MNKPSGFAALLDICLLLLIFSPAASFEGRFDNHSMPGHESDAVVDENNSLVVKVTGDGGIFVNDDEISIEQIHSQKGSRTIFVLVQPPLDDPIDIGAIEYRRLISQIRLVAKEAGFEQIGDYTTRLEGN